MIGDVPQTGDRLVPGAIMARKVAASKKPPIASGAKSVAFRVSGEYAAWLERAAAHDRSSVSAFLDRAAANYAKIIQFEAPPSRNG